jgi:hypothetical protein
VAKVATSMLRSFPYMRIGLFVGISGDVPSERLDIRLGSIVVSTPIAATVAYLRKAGEVEMAVRLTQR